MTAKSMNRIRGKDIAIVLAATAAILAIPLVAMQFSDDWDWKLSDFIIMGTLIAGTGLLIALAARKIKGFNGRVLAIAGLVIALLLVWAELAVGIFGTPFAGS